MRWSNPISKSYEYKKLRHTFFSPNYARLCFSLVSCRVEFVVGDKPVNNFRMIERHYFKERLLKTFDFNFGFCIPNSKNTCEHIYEFPPLSSEESEYIWPNMSKWGYHTSFPLYLQKKVSRFDPNRANIYEFPPFNLQEKVSTFDPAWVNEDMMVHEGTKEILI